MSQLSPICVAALHIAQKYDEVKIRKLAEIVDTCSFNEFTRAEVVAAEHDILLTLQFDVASTSAYRFLERLWHMFYGSSKDRKMFFFA